MSDDKFNYKHNHEDYDPHAGSNMPGDDDLVPTYSGSYADIDNLNQRLQLLIDQVRSFERLLEGDLSGLALFIDRSDTKLVESHRLEWPETLGDPGDKVSYRYYKALRLRNSTSASYLRKRFEEAARDVTGTTAIDLLLLASVIKDEALLIQEFISAYVGTVDDSSEHRTVEIFQDWVESALGYTRKFRAFYEEGEEAEELLPQSEIDNTTADEAKQGQAVFKVKLNSFNDNIVKNEEMLRKNFAEHAPTFYRRYLGPAMNFRLNVGRRVLPTGSRLMQEVEAASASIDSDLRMAQADQQRRRKVFTQKMGEIFEDIRQRDKYRNFIIQLSVKGRPVKTEGARVFIGADESAEEIDFWRPTDDVETLPADASPLDDGTFEASHKVLTGVKDDDAHPQYLLKSGGMMTGDLELDEDVQVDGMRPGTHAHKGDDGTPKIHGADLVHRSLLNVLVDPNDKPPVPQNLSVVRHRGVSISPGLFSVDSLIEWEGSHLYKYEVQVARIPEPSLKPEIIDTLIAPVTAPFEPSPDAAYANMVVDVGMDCVMTIRQNRYRGETGELRYTIDLIGYDGDKLVRKDSLYVDPSIFGNNLGRSDSLSARYYGPDSHTRITRLRDGVVVLGSNGGFISVITTDGESIIGYKTHSWGAEHELSLLANFDVTVTPIDEEHVLYMTGAEGDWGSNYFAKIRIPEGGDIEIIEERHAPSVGAPKVEHEQIDGQEKIPDDPSTLSTRWKAEGARFDEPNQYVTFATEHGYLNSEEVTGTHIGVTVLNMNSLEWEDHLVVAGDSNQRFWPRVATETSEGVVFLSAHPSWFQNHNEGIYFAVVDPIYPDADADALELNPVSAAASAGAAENTIDGDPATYWEATGRAENSAENGPWITWELDGLYRISRAFIAFHEGDDGDSSVFYLEVSENGTLWERALPVTTASGDSLEPESFDIEPIYARYVRFVGEGREASDRNAITQAKFLGVPHDAVVDPEAVAFRKLDTLIPFGETHPDYEIEGKTRIGPRQIWPCSTPDRNWIFFIANILRVDTELDEFEPTLFYGRVQENKSIRVEGFYTLPWIAKADPGRLIMLADGLMMLMADGKDEDGVTKLYYVLFRVGDNDSIGYVAGPAGGGTGRYSYSEAGEYIPPPTSDTNTFTGGTQIDWGPRPT